MKLIHDWRDWRASLRLFSIQALLLIGVLQGTVAALPDSVLDLLIPGTQVSWRALATALSVAAALLGGIGRLINQTPTAPPA